MHLKLTRFRSIPPAGVAENSFFFHFFASASPSQPVDSDPILQIGSTYCCFAISRFEGKEEKTQEEEEEEEEE